MGARQMQHATYGEVIGMSGDRELTFDFPLDTTEPVRKELVALSLLVHPECPSAAVRWLQGHAWRVLGQPQKSLAHQAQLRALRARVEREVYSRGVER